MKNITRLNGVQTNPQKGALQQFKTNHQLTIKKLAKTLRYSERSTCRFLANNPMKPYVAIMLEELQGIKKEDLVFTPEIMAGHIPWSGETVDLKTYKRINKLSTRQLARKIGRSYRQTCKYLAGLPMKVEKAVELEEYLGINKESLVFTPEIIEEV